jgi:hypothetical protein
MSANHDRRKAVRARMAATGEKYTEAARALAASDGEPEVWPILSGLPTVQVVPVEPPGDVYEWGRYGLIERTTTGWLITPSYSGEAWKYGRENPLVRVDYRDPVTWEPKVTELPPMAKAIPGPNGVRWTWACNGWAVDEPGDIADEAAKPAPSSELPYEVRAFSVINEGQVFPLDWFGSSPGWGTEAWCYTADVARALAEGAARRLRPASSVVRAQVWGPTANGREVVFSVDSSPELRATHPGFRKFRTLPSMPRPVAPAPTPEPAWDTGVPANELPLFNVRAWSPDTGWSTLLWADSRSSAAVAADCLLVGQTEKPYPYGDAWGPGWKREWNAEYGGPTLTNERDGYDLMDRFPDMTHEERLAQDRARRAQLRAQSNPVPITEALHQVAGEARPAAPTSRPAHDRQGEPER